MAPRTAAETVSPLAERSVQKTVVDLAVWMVPPTVLDSDDEKDNATASPMAVETVSQTEAETADMLGSHMAAYLVAHSDYIGAVY